MSLEIEQLLAKLGADTGAYRRECRKVERQARRLGARLRRELAAAGFEYEATGVTYPDVPAESERG